MKGIKVQGQSNTTNTDNKGEIKTNKNLEKFRIITLPQKSMCFLHLSQINYLVQADGQVDT